MPSAQLGTASGTLPLETRRHNELLYCENCPLLWITASMHLLARYDLNSPCSDVRERVR
jgi:hypothetical protein